MEKTIRKFAFVFMVVGLSVLSAAALAGQGPFAPAQSPMDLILEKLVAIEEVVAPSEPSETTLRTSALVVILFDDAFAVVECTATNVSTRPIEVTQTLKNGSGQVVASRTRTMAPGVTGSFAERETQGIVRCEFTFTGFADEIRANMTAKTPENLEQAVFEAR